MEWKPRHVLGLVASLSVAAVLAPIGVMAATGQVVNIFDPVYSHRQARVASGGALTVETRAGTITNGFNSQGSRLGLGWIKLAETTGPTKLVITEVTVTGQGPSGNQEILLETLVRTSGTDPCTGPGTPGWTRTTHRRVAVSNGQSIQQLFNGPPLMLPGAASGQPFCFGVTVVSIPSGSATYASTTGYRY
jgi:hypothetical protein